MNSQFLTNYGEIKFIDKIKDCLNRCNEFYLSVSFIKFAGLILIKKEIEEALERGAKGMIITSTYQNFTDIASLNYFLDLMNKYDNFICNLDYQCFGDNGFHSKGYIFKMDNHDELLIGSTNITRFALLKNIEWNLYITSKNNEETIDSTIKEFDYLWNKTVKLNYDLIRQYQIQIDYAIEKWDMDYIDPASNIIKPNAMQRRALKEIRRYRDMGQNKCLIVSATASGKTYVSIFDAKNYDAKRLLFIVHRDSILKSAKDSFAKVFGAERSYGLYTGDVQELDRDFIFATPTMLANHLDVFASDEFDYIVYDECHHVVANNMKKIMEYFSPGFTLGLTATPERMDNQDVFSMFDNNVPYELRLRDALLNNLVCPFKYYGIRDELIDYSSNDKSMISKEISKSENIEFIANEIEKHRVKGKLKAIAFCTTIAHASIMADLFNEVGYHALALTGSNDLGQRIKAFNSLQDETNELEIICAVDILNEGVDIPSVNMVLFLRPTESSTVFIQQLGRGLRKYPGKDYVIVLDFIGNNYDRSVQMALALGSLNENNIVEKPMLKRLISEDFRPLQLPIEINIDSLSKEAIIDEIDKTNFNSKKFLVSDYNNFKKYIGQTPKYMDYINNDCAPNILRFINSSKNYYRFLVTLGDNEIVLNDNQEKLVTKLSWLLPIVRTYEYQIIKNMLEGITYVEDIITSIKIDSNSFNQSQFNHALDLLTSNNKYKCLINENGQLSFDNIEINDSFKEYLLDLIEYGLTRYSIEFGEFDTLFKMYGNYKTEQIKMAMGESLMQVQGTIVKEDGTIFILAGLKKDASIAEHLNYADKFIDKKTFQWESTTNVTMTNNQGLRLINSKIAHLFIRKMEKEDNMILPYTYIGTGHLADVKEGTKSKPTLIFQVKLDNEIPEYLRFDFEIEE